MNDDSDRELDEAVWPARSSQERDAGGAACKCLRTCRTERRRQEYGNKYHNEPRPAECWHRQRSGRELTTPRSPAAHGDRLRFRESKASRMDARRAFPGVCESALSGMEQ